MTQPDCRRWIAEIVECARIGSRPSSHVQAHLAGCPACTERLEDERRLTLEMCLSREVAGVRRVSAARRARIMREFQTMHRPSVRPWLKVVLAAAALLLLVIGLLHTPGSQKGVSEVAGDLESLTADSDFVAIPYAPPLASGEFVSVVRTELQPTALARMGVYVDAGYASSIPADVVVGEDGLPRAVRVVEITEF
jgi:hypothetical protein